MFVARANKLSYVINRIKFFLSHRVDDNDIYCIYLKLFFYTNLTILKNRYFLIKLSFEQILNEIFVNFSNIQFRLNKIVRSQTINKCLIYRKISVKKTIKIELIDNSNKFFINTKSTINFNRDFDIFKSIAININVNQTLFQQLSRMIPCYF